MRYDLEQKLIERFPILYNDTHSKYVVHFECCDGWFDIIYNLSCKLEKLVKSYIEENPDLICFGCGCERDKHHGYGTLNPGKCLAIHLDPKSKADPPGNYYACWCDEYQPDFPKVSQIKEKFGGLRVYMTFATDEMFDIIQDAEDASFEICEMCGAAGRERELSWIKTLCDECIRH